MIDSNTPKLNKDVFRFIVPAEMEKAADGSYRIRGLASTEKVDQQGETIIQKGVDLTPIDKKKGILNWDHQKGPENTIGVLDGYQRTQKGLFIEGRLFKNHTKAKAVREIMESLGEGDRGRMGLSVEGRILERDPLNPSVIRKCQINAVALTMNPVNTETYADVVKSMNAAEILEIDAQEETQTESKVEEPTFTAGQVMAIVQKALGVGAGSMGPPAARTGGDALAQEDLDHKKLAKACPVCGKEPCACEKKKMRKMDKGMYKSNLLMVLDKLQVLYPNHSRSEIWEAVKDRLETKFDIQKGGVGSGKKGHVTPKHTLISQIKVKAPHLDEKELGMMSREHLEQVHAHHNGTQWDKVKSPPYNRNVEKESSHSKEREDLEREADEVTDNAVQSWSSHSNDELRDIIKEHKAKKGLRLKNTSGKEREHKLYEQARQRGDYDENKDKSRIELDQIARDSGLPAKEKEQIRVQHDAAVQVGDREHVRPNVKD